MNIIIYMIFGWLIGEFLHFTIWEWFKKKLKLDEQKVKSILIFVGIALIIAIIGSGFYRVTSNENIILTSMTGKKIVKESHGIKFSLLSSREEISTQSQIIQFPFSYSDSSYEIITSDNKPLFINSFLEYKIKNVYRWGIESKDSAQKLLVSFTSNVKNTIQKRKYDDIRNNLDSLETEIKEEMIKLQEVYGIEVVKVNLQISDTISVKQAKSNVESQKISSEGLKESYLSEAKALQTKYASLEDKEFIKYMEFIKSIKEGNVEVIVVPEDSIISHNLNGEETG